MLLELNSDLQHKWKLSVWGAIKWDSLRCSIRCNYRPPSYFCHLKMKAGSRALNYGEAVFHWRRDSKSSFRNRTFWLCMGNRGSHIFTRVLFSADIMDWYWTSAFNSIINIIREKQPLADDLKAVISAPGEAGLKALHNTCTNLPSVSALCLNHHGGIFLASSRWSVWSFSVGENGQLGPIKLCSWHSYQGDRENTSHRSYFYSQNSNIKEQFDRCMMVRCDMKNLRGDDGWTTQAGWLAAVGAYTGPSEMGSRPPV